MFYRFTPSGARISIDLDDLFFGSSLFLLGGGPSLKDMPLELLKHPSIITLAMNNVPCVFNHPTMWVCADKPPCFSQHIYASPTIMKFTMISRRSEMVGITGKKVFEFPNMFFYGVKDFSLGDFLNKDRDLVWWKSVFPIALQLAHRLGFRRVYLVGCGFKMSKGSQYAWKTELTNYQLNYSQRTYNNDLNRLRSLKPVFDANKFEVISSTPDSVANEILGYIPIEEAIYKERETYPSVSDTMSLVHSSAFGPKGD